MCAYRRGAVGVLTVVATRQAAQIAAVPVEASAP